MTRDAAWFDDADSPDILGGEWWNDHGIQRWRPTTTPTTAPVKRKPNVHSLIACTRCNAAMDERCKSPAGNPVANHRGRLEPVRCPCGRSVDTKKQYCITCARMNRVKTYRSREARMPTKLRRAS